MNKEVVGRLYGILNDLRKIEKLLNSWTPRDHRNIVSEIEYALMLAHSKIAAVMVATKLRPRKIMAFAEEIAKTAKTMEKDLEKELQKALEEGDVEKAAEIMALKTFLSYMKPKKKRRAKREAPGTTG